MKTCRSHSEKAAVRAFRGHASRLSRAKAQAWSLVANLVWWRLCCIKVPACFKRRWSEPAWPRIVWTREGKPSPDFRRLQVHQFHSVGDGPSVWMWEGSSLNLSPISFFFPTLLLLLSLFLCESLIELSAVNALGTRLSESVCHYTDFTLQSSVAILTFHTESLIPALRTIYRFVSTFQILTTNLF